MYLGIGRGEIGDGHGSVDTSAGLSGALLHARYVMSSCYYRRDDGLPQQPGISSVEGGMNG